MKYNGCFCTNTKYASFSDPEMCICLGCFNLLYKRRVGTLKKVIFNVGFVYRTTLVKNDWFDSFEKVLDEALAHCNYCVEGGIFDIEFNDRFIRDDSLALTQVLADLKHKKSDENCL